MTPNVLINFLIAALTGATVAFLLIRPVMKRFAARLDDLIPNPNEPALESPNQQILVLIHELSARVDELERRQEFELEIAQTRSRRIAAPDDSATEDVHYGGLTNR